MANTIRIKRRATGGAAGAPTSLENAELAFNETDNTLYYGKGTGGAGGTATTVEVIGGLGAFVSLTSAQTVTGPKTFSVIPLTATALTSDSSTQVATTEFVKVQGYTSAVGTVTSVSALTLETTGTDIASSVATSTSTPVITLNIPTASAANRGALAPADWTTFNNKQPAGAYLTAEADTLATVTGRGATTSIATTFSNGISMSSSKITNLADPTAAQDAATKAYVDAARQGLSVKNAVRAATVGNIILSGTQTIDSTVALVAGDRVLVKDQTAPSSNGIYVVSATAWTRAVDADGSGELVGGAFTFVQEGSTNQDSGWVCTTDGPVTLGTTALNFTQFSGAGSITAGVGLSKTGNTLGVSLIPVLNGGTGATTAAGALANLGAYAASNPNGYTSAVGTVTSVSALTLGTTGTDIASSVATSTSTPVITLNIPTASAANRGALSSADWTTFNNKQPAGAYLTTAAAIDGGTF